MLMRVRNVYKIKWELKKILETKMIGWTHFNRTVIVYRVHRIRTTKIFGDHQIYFLPNFVYFFFSTHQNQFNREIFCWLTDSIRNSFAQQKVNIKKTDSWYLVKKIFGIPGNFGGLDPAKSGESVNCVERLDQNSDSVNGLFRTGLFLKIWKNYRCWNIMPFLY